MTGRCSNVSCLPSHLHDKGAAVTQALAGSVSTTYYLPVRLNLNFWPFTEASAIRPPFAIVNMATPLW